MRVACANQTIASLQGFPYEESAKPIYVGEVKSMPATTVVYQIAERRLRIVKDRLPCISMSLS